MRVALALPIGILVLRPAAVRADDCRRGAEPGAAIAACSSLIAASRDARVLERAHNLRGLAYEATGQFQLAVDDATEVIRRDPKVAGFFDNRARAYRGLGRSDLALKDADMAVRMAPGYAFVFRGRGLAYGDLGRYDLAARDFDAAVAIDPADAGLRVERGRAVAMLDRPEDALADFSAALALRPGDPAALRERGLVRRRLGDVDGARADLAAALAAAPGDAVAAGALGQIGPPRDAAAGVQGAGPARLAAGAQRTPFEQMEEEANQRKKKEMEEEANRAKMDEEFKARRLSRARDEAQPVLKIAAGFLAANRDDASVNDHLRRIQRLQAALGKGDPDVIVSDTQDLNAGLGADPAYAAFRARTKAKDESEHEQMLGDAMRTLSMQHAFLIDAAARDALSPASSVFVTLADQIPSLQANPDLGRAEALSFEIGEAIKRAGLTQSYADFARLGAGATSGGGQRDGRDGDAPAFEPPR